MPTPTQPTDEEVTKVAKTLSREEVAWLMKINWRALQAPRWTFQNKKDLEKLGEALFSGKKLKDLDSAVLDRIFPHLLVVTQYLGALLKLGMPDHEAPRTSLPASPSPPAVPTPLAIVSPKPDISPASNSSHDEALASSVLAGPKTEQQP